nr:MAG TPA: hypothetical protein [Caudoviricetes sp.]
MVLSDIIIIFIGIKLGLSVNLSFSNVLLCLPQFKLYCYN